MGDFNINLLNEDSHASTREFIDTNLAHSHIMQITKPTRITGSTATIIDNIFTNNVNVQICMKGALLVSGSDHLPIIYIEESMTKSKANAKIKTWKRKINDKEMENLKKNSKRETF